MYEPYAVVNQPLICVNDVGGELLVSEFRIKDCFACARVGVDGATGMEYCFDLHLVMVASRFELKHAEDIVPVHSIGKIPEPEGSGDGFDVCGQLPDNISQFDG